MINLTNAQLREKHGIDLDTWDGLEVLNTRCGGSKMSRYVYDESAALFLIKKISGGNTKCLLTFDGSKIVCSIVTSMGDEQKEVTYIHWDICLAICVAYVMYQEMQKQ